MQQPFVVDTDIDIREYAPITLAFVGDAVFGLLVRQRLVAAARQPLGRLNAAAIGYVSARGQAAALEQLAPLLTEEEAAVVRRGRNANKSSVSRHATRQEYQASTALEALFGWLYLQNRHDRLAQLFDAVWQALSAENAQL